ncbi:hypothetical protein Hs30E_15120 [Lactococcus hodotermopsidis]|uniref:F5/8 type C domain-containing protein n=1 Tax=Pseudolactococcus hodotermopsidis TaxID=2709157 RepID=A0A6A0BFB5_9LACT|nr:discoidin domain-containing protein [Lactococcus hodotermopsidis]GFH42961.1 hypothetical protein Hs30E_15120 [Lactococcus hodotermopsidis]
MKTDKYVVAFRTHYWSDDIEKIYNNLVKNVNLERWDVIVFADETNGELATPEYTTKISHTEADLASLGLPLIPAGQALWANGDYAMYALKEKVDAPAYVITENDTFINSRTLFESMADFYDNGGDMLAHHHREVPANDNHVRSGARGNVLDSPFGMLNVWVWGAKPTTIDFLVQKRLEVAQRSDLSFQQWPKDELFLGTTVLHHQEINFLDIASLDEDYDYLAYRPVYSILDARVWQGNKIVHPVVSQSSVFSKYSYEYNFFLAQHHHDYSEGSKLWRLMMLSYLDKSNQTIYSGMIASVILSPTLEPKPFADFCLAHQLTYDNQLDLQNKAFLKEVTGSEPFSYNRSQFPYHISMTDGNYDVDKYRFGGFASKRLQDPWIQVDLADITTISKINLYHRHQYFERTKNLDIEISLDGESYEKIAELRDIEFTKEASTRNKEGHVFVLRNNFDVKKARYVKITLRTFGGRQILNLNQIEIY